MYVFSVNIMYSFEDVLLNETKFTFLVKHHKELHFYDWFTTEIQKKMRSLVLLNTPTYSLVWSLQCDLQEHKNGPWQGS